MVTGHCKEEGDGMRRGRGSQVGERSRRREGHKRSEGKSRSFFYFLCLHSLHASSLPAVIFSLSLFSPKTGLRTLFSPQSSLEAHPCASCSSFADSCSAFSHNKPAPSVPMIRWTASRLRFEMTRHWIGMTCCHQAGNNSSSQHHQNPLFKRCRKSTSR